MAQVLLIEDEDGFGGAMIAELYEMGLNPEWAKDGETALSYLEKRKYDGVILDLRLDKPPAPQGMQILEWLNAHRPDTAIVVVTAHSHLAFRALDLGVDTLIQKPVEMQHVVQYLQRAIQLRSLRKENERLLEVIKGYEYRGEEDRLSESLGYVKTICTHFHLSARRLQSRHADRTPFPIDDEFDVQDLLHALLSSYFEDIRVEEYSPSYAGAGARLDFLLKREGIVIEVKKTRRGLGAKEVGDELLVDIQRYREHPDCRKLICLIYDPDGRIVNPRGLERDLTRTSETLEVYVFVSPSGL